MSAESEHLIVGGGLAGGLVALALANRGRGTGVVLVEQGHRMGGNHTWSFHDTDIARPERDLVDPLVTKRWPRHVVRFPDHERTFESGYASIASDTFADVLTARLASAGVRVHLGRHVTAVGATSVRLDGDATSLRARVVIDARGPEPVGGDAAAAAAAGGDRTVGPRRGGGDSAFQKFVGLELQLRAPGPWTDPVLMDATIGQFDGFRFIYVLPFTPRRVLIEDTVYSGNADVDPVAAEGRVLEYAARHGAIVDGVLRREIGVLPLPLRAPERVRPKPRSPAQDARPIAIGYRGGFFHPVTGYSLPLAARVALAIAGARTPVGTVAAVRAVLLRLGAEARFGRLLNRLMFRAMAPGVRWTALDRFYRLPEATIARFYASRSTWWDRARVLVGRPPAGLSWKHVFGASLDPALNSSWVGQR